MTIFSPSEWMILALIFVLGLLIGMFLTAGGRRKWKTRYRDEAGRREALEKEHRDREKHWESREKEWREQDSLRGAAARDHDRDGVPDNRDRRPSDDRRA
jgi:hypothetical protein